MLESLINESNKYILITAAKNEQGYIEGTIKSVISQNIKPILWIIVSDGSTDNTDDIVKMYADQYEFMQYIRNDKTDDRNFASKVYAINSAISTIKNIDYDFIGILDADITFDSNYYEKIFEEFNKDLKLGIAGGDFFDVVNGRKVKVVKTSDSVRGGIQLFRKECFKQIGNFLPLENGGEDVVMEVRARMNGWKVQSFDHLILLHHRLTGTEGFSVFRSRFREGILSHSMGYNPIFQIIKSFYRIKEKPYLIAGALHLFGFLWAYLGNNKVKVDDDFKSYLRKEQRQKLKNLF
jgi:glycosyltransferase involved in cell wall biosynthesis